MFVSSFLALVRLRAASDSPTCWGEDSSILENNSFGLEMVYSGRAETNQDESGAQQSSFISVNPLRLFKGSLWWVEKTESLEFKGAMGSAVVLAASPMLVFGAWAAFFSYLGHDPATNMDYISLEYQTFFGCFVDLELQLPALFEFDFSFLTHLGIALMDLPSFESLPPSAMLEGSRAFAALSFIAAFLKPIVSLLGLILEFYGLVGKHMTVGEVAEAEGNNDLESSFKAWGGDATNLSRCLGPSINIVGRSSGGVEEISIIEKNTAFIISVLQFTPLVVSINFSGCGELASGISNVVKLHDRLQFSEGQH
jgi:hypothetical protein